MSFSLKGLWSSYMFMYSRFASLYSIWQPPLFLQQSTDQRINPLKVSPAPTGCLSKASCSPVPAEAKMSCDRFVDVIIILHTVLQVRVISIHLCCCMVWISSKCIVGWCICNCLRMSTKWRFFLLPFPKSVHNKFRCIQTHSIWAGLGLQE